jgi:hypothetical protein
MGAQVPISREIWIERSDALDPPAKFSVSRAVKCGANAFIIKCVDVVKNAAGDVAELICE